MSYKYIPYIPKPLLNDFIKNRVVPFVGAGFSKNAEIPKGLSMPNWNELGELAANEITDYDYDKNPIDALSYYESLYSRTKLVEFLMDILHVGEIRPGETYIEFCKLFTGTICTTNYDFLLEEAMSSLQRPVSTIVTEDRLTVNTPFENRILKLHGDFNHPEKMVITEHDYDMYLENNPVFATYVSNLFITNTMLLIGYSLDDDDFRSIWQILNNRLGGMAQPAYCLVVGASQAQIARYARRNIHVISLPGEIQNYKTILRDFFSEMNDFLSTEKDKAATSKDDRINEQLLIPSENNKLCYISCSIKRIAQLSSLLYPILRSHGITPVRTDDMLMPGDNWIDIVGTIIRKSKLAIVDISDESPSVYAELAMLQSEKKKIKIICEEGIELSPSILSSHVISRYSFDLTSDNNLSFIKQLAKWIDASIDIALEKTNNNTPIIFEDAHRLLQKKEYSACIVSAYSDFEFLIRKAHLTFSPKTDWYYNLVNSGILSSKEIKGLQDIRMMRNQIVHGRFNDVKESIASNALDLLTSIYIKFASESKTN